MRFNFFIFYFPPFHLDLTVIVGYSGSAGFLPFSFPLSARINLSLPFPSPTNQIPFNPKGIRDNQSNDIRRQRFIIRGDSKGTWLYIFFIPGPMDLLEAVRAGLSSRFLITLTYFSCFPPATCFTARFHYHILCKAEKRKKKIPWSWIRNIKD